MATQDNNALLRLFLALYEGGFTDFKVKVRYGQVVLITWPEGRRSVNRFPLKDAARRVRNIAHRRGYTPRLDD